MPKSKTRKAVPNQKGRTSGDPRHATLMQASLPAERLQGVLATILQLTWTQDDFPRETRVVGVYMTPKRTIHTHNFWVREDSPSVENVASALSQFPKLYDFPSEVWQGQEDIGLAALSGFYVDQVIHRDGMEPLYYGDLVSRSGAAVSAHYSTDPSHVDGDPPPYETPMEIIGQWLHALPR